MLFDPKRLKTLLRSKAIDVAVITSPENVYYLSQYTGPMYPWSGCTTCVVFPTEGSPSLIVNMCEGLAPFSQETEIRDIRFYDEFYFYFSQELPPEENEFRKAYDTYYARGTKSDISAVKEAIESQRLRSGAKIGVERSMPRFLRNALEQFFPNAKLEDVTPLFQEARIIKTEEETRRLREVAKINEKALNAAIESIHVGVSEWELVMAYRQELDRQKAEPIFNLINAGKRGGELFPTYRHAHKLQRGDVVRMDVGCRYNGYSSDLSRSVTLGQLSPSDERIRQAVLKGCWSTISGLKPGLAVREVFQKAIEMIRQAGIPDFRRSNIGHGIGMDAHELPDMSGSSPTTLEKDMVLNIETPYYGVGIGGFQQEDTARITDDGVEIITHLDRDIRLSG